MLDAFDFVNALSMYFLLVLGMGPGLVINLALTLIRRKAPGLEEFMAITVVCGGLVLIIGLVSSIHQLHL